MVVRIAAVTAVAVVLAAPPALAATPEQHNCAGVFASTSADGQVISGLAVQFRGVSELVLPDANCGENAP